MAKRSSTTTTVHDRDWHLINAATCASPLLDLATNTLVSCERTARSHALESGRSSDDNEVDDDFVVIDMRRPTYSQVLGVITPPNITRSAVYKTTDKHRSSPGEVVRQQRDYQIEFRRSTSQRWQYADIQLRKSGKHYVPVAS